MRFLRWVAEAVEQPFLLSLLDDSAVVADFRQDPDGDRIRTGCALGAGPGGHAAHTRLISG